MAAIRIADALYPKDELPRTKSQDGGSFSTGDGIYKTQAITRSDTDNDGEGGSLLNIYSPLPQFFSTIESHDTPEASPLAVKAELTMQDVSESRPIAGKAKVTTRRRQETAPAEKIKEIPENGETKPFFTHPTYTMKEIHDAIPAHCFERNTLLSVSYVLRDFLFVAILMGLASHILHLPSPYLRVPAWATYAFCQGLVFTGLWELAHECGHGALSRYKWANNSMGLVIHSLLLVPYHSWRFTHSQHHKATNNIERDIAFVPDTKDVWMAARKARKPEWVFMYWDLVEDMPIVNLLILVGHQLIAWPIYLAINNFALPRMRAVVWWKRSHFYFGSDGPNFKPSNRDDVILSDFGIGLVAAALWASVNYFGVEKVFLFYGAPWLWTNHWILTITFLQHTDSSLAYYPSKTWSFLRGAASTVDRDFGFIGRNLFHGAIEYHVLHHHASRIPCYHAEEASNAIKGVMGSHYQSDVKTPLLWAFWRNYNSCRFVEEKDVGSGVYFFGKK